MTKQQISPPSSVVIAKYRVYPDKKSTLGDLKLSVSDLPMLACHYIQKGLLYTLPPLLSPDALVALLKRSLSQTLSLFPPLAGRMITDSAGFVYVACNDAGVDFVHANAGNLRIRDVLSPPDVPDCVKRFFSFDGAVSYDGHCRPLVAVQLTELTDGVFLGCAVNHAVTDGTSFWNFFNSLAEVCRGVSSISRPPNFTRNFVKDSPAVLRFPDGGPKVSFDASAPIRERILHFSREAIQELKAKANGRVFSRPANGSPAAEIFGKLCNDEVMAIIHKSEIIRNQNGKIEMPNGAPKNPVSEIPASAKADRTEEISSFQSLCAALWRAVTRARKLSPAAETTFRMAVNCRHRIEPRIDTYYFGNAIQSIRTVASAGELLSRDLRWCAGLLHANVGRHGDETIRRGVSEWERDPRVFPLGNPDGASITMGSSPRFPMYDNDLGWGRPLAIRSGRSNKFDGKISAFPGRAGGGSVDLEVCLAPETMAALETDTEFMQYARTIW